VKFDLKLNPYGQLYLPKELRENVLGGETEVEIHPSWGAGMIVPKGTDPEQVLKSLETLRSHFEEMIEEEGGEREI